MKKIVMKKIVLSLLSFTLIGLSHIASADDLLAWAEMSKGSYVAPGCYWQAGGSTPYGPVIGLWCNGVNAATRTPNQYGPETVSAGGNYYVVPHSGGSAPVNGYNYAIYKRTTAACYSHGTVVGTYPNLQTASANYSYDLQKCGTNCSMNIIANGSQYQNVCN